MALATIQRPTALSIWNEEEIQVLKEVIAKGATDAELVLFAKVCERLQLDPFTKQIYLIKRDGKPTIQTGIDGFRAIADRTDRYAGNDEYRFDEGLTEYEHIMEKRGNPVTATATVYKIVQGVRAAFTATAHWKEYYPGPKQGFMWDKMPYTMLGKTAEAQALRRAFPTQLSGVYGEEEMAQAGPGDYDQQAPKNEPPAKAANDDDQPLSQPNTRRLYQRCRELNVPVEEFALWSQEVMHTTPEHFTVGQGRSAWKWITAEGEAIKAAQDAELLESALAADIPFEIEGTVAK